MSSELLTTAETAVLLSKSVSTVTRMADRGDLPFVRKLPGKNGYLFSRDVVEYAARLAAEAVS
jgi:excisionase family DNA binding protein